MKHLIRLFFRTLRIVLGPFMLLWEFVTTPKGVVRPPAAQREVDRQCAGMAMYQFRTCPFCIKTRREIRRLSLNIELLDARESADNRAALLAGGGEIKVPCLRITDEQGNQQWLYESGKIIAYLQQRFA